MSFDQGCTDLSFADFWERRGEEREGDEDGVRGQLSLIINQKSDDARRKGRMEPRPLKVTYDVAEFWRSDVGLSSLDVATADIFGSETEGQRMFTWDWVSVLVRIREKNVDEFWIQVEAGWDREGVSEEARGPWKKRIDIEFV